MARLFVPRNHRGGDSTVIDLYCNLMMIMSPAGEWKNKAFADNIIKETNAHWKALVTNKGVSDEVETKNTSVQNSHGLITLVFNHNSIIQSGNSN